MFITFFIHILNKYVVNCDKLLLGISWYYVMYIWYWLIDCSKWIIL